MRGPRSLLITRVGASRHRCADDDQQAVELFIDGVRIVHDPGTYRYSGSPPWRQPFTSSALHSMARPATDSPRLSVGRFLREPMPTAAVTARSCAGETEVVVTCRVEGNVRLTRAFLRIGDRYAVVDAAVGGPAVVRWLFSEHQTANHDRVLVPAPTNVRERDDADPGSGWWSPTYAQLEPALATEAELADGGVLVARFAREGEPLLRIEEIATALAEQVDLQLRLTTLSTTRAGRAA
jgi:hypothetical protein